MLQTLVILLVIFVLAMYVGFVLIQRVPPILHTPLMSGSNAISGITIGGAIVVAGMHATRRAGVLGTIAIAFAMINVVRGYRATDRMLAMFKKEPGAK